MLPLISLTIHRCNVEEKQIWNILNRERGGGLVVNHAFILGTMEFQNRCLRPTQLVLTIIYRRESTNQQMSFFMGAKVGYSNRFES